MQLSEHISTAAWSSADKALNVLLGVALILPQKVIGENYFGEYITVLALLNTVYMLSDGLSLQAMVNYGQDEKNRAQALTHCMLMHVAFVAACTAIIYFGRFELAVIFNKPYLSDSLRLFPLWSGAFVLRTYLLKISQMSIDTFGTFLIDAAWAGTTIGLTLLWWQGGTLRTGEDMIMIGAVAGGASTAMGLILYWRRIRLTLRRDKDLTRAMFRFGLAQCGSAGTMALQSQGDVLLLSRFVTSAIVGNYSAAKTFFRGFEGLRDAGALFVYPAVARLRTQGRQAEIVPLVEKMIAFMLIVIIPIVVLLWVGPTDYLFNLVYKGKYLEAPMVLKVLSLAAPAIPFGMNLVVLYGLGAARTSLRITVTVATVFFAAGFVLIWQFGIIGAAVTVVISYALLGFLATRALRTNLEDFSLKRTLGRWRDAGNFVQSLRRRTGGK